MATHTDNYNCTLMGCVSQGANPGTYPDLLSCESACVGWGCPPQITDNTNIVWVYDSSSSYTAGGSLHDNDESRRFIFESITAYCQTLTQAGWVGSQEHVIAYDMGYKIDSAGNIDWSSWQNLNATALIGGVNYDMGASTYTYEGWLEWSQLPYLYTNREHGIRQGLNSNSLNTTVIPNSVQEQYFSRWFLRDAVDVTGATYPTVPTLVVSLIHQTSTSYGMTTNYGTDATNSSWPQAPQFRAHYTIWDKLWDNSPDTSLMKAFCFPIKVPCEATNNAGGWWKSLQYTLQSGIQTILNGNQNDVANGGTGTLDGSWISYPLGTVMPNGNTCMESNCTTAPLGPATSNPCVENFTCPGEVLCYWSDNSINAYTVSTYWTDMQDPTNLQPGYRGINYGWVAGVPTWGGFQDKGWGIDVSLQAADPVALAAALASSLGSITTPATICLSAATDYTIDPDYGFPTLQLCNDDCFPTIDPWHCPPGGSGCIQDPLGSYGWVSSVPTGPYATSLAAEAACTASCVSVTSYTCNMFGCAQDPSGIFESLSACTASCQSYSCTTAGCYGPYQGTGGTGTFHNPDNPTWGLTACTGTCHHYECVTDTYALSVLPNIYDAGTSSTNGCIQTSGSVNTTIMNQYATLDACTGACVSWQCCSPLGITDNTDMYIYYDITSMNTGQVTAGIQGIIDWTENHPLFTGNVYHLLWWTERWLTYPVFPYTHEVWRFEDITPSSYPGYAGTQSYFGTTYYGHTSYWANGNPGHVLKATYAASGFDTWINGTNYTGNATHSVHDSFEAGTNCGTWNAAWNGVTTRGTSPIPLASYADDIINVIFQDESYAMYHNTSTTNFNKHSATQGTYNEPTQRYRDDHGQYFSVRNTVTATTGSIRSLLYPTAGGNYSAGGGFALHSIAAIDSGTNIPPNGKWTWADYPANNLAGHAQCQYSLPTLVTTNPYWEIVTPTLIGDYDTSGVAYDVDVSGNYAYVADGADGLDIIDISTPASPTLVGNYNTSGEASGVTVNGNYAYVADGTDGLDIIDISNPASPTLVGNYDTAGLAHKVVISGDGTTTYAYVADGISGLTIVDVTDPAAPTLKGTYNTPGTVLPVGTTYAVTLSGNGTTNYAYLADGSYGLQVVDVTNPASPTWAGSANTSGNAFGLTLDDGFAYVADGPDGVDVFEIDGMNNINLVGNINTSGNAYDVAKDDWRLLVADGTRVYVLDASDPTAPIIAATGSYYHTNGVARSLVREGNTAYVADGNLGGLKLLDVSSPFTPTWGGLDQQGWSINFRFDTYSQAIFETDLTEFLQTSTISCDTICTSAYTNTSAQYPFSSVTDCEGLIEDGNCTGCTRFDCGVNGCFTATSGTYDCLSQCTAACQSYSCTTTGCTDYNLPTGTTFPYTSIDGVSYYSYYGTGGTYTDSNQCQTECVSWNCGYGGCSSFIGTGGTFTTQGECELECSGYTCDQTGAGGCVTYIGDGSAVATTTFPTEQLCLTSCTIYECGVMGCLPVPNTGQLNNPLLDEFFPNLSSCTATCWSFNCSDTGCYPLSNITGTYQDLSQIPSVSEAACTATCVTWNCFSAGCDTQLGTGGTYTTSGDCVTGNTILGLDACRSWSCTTIGCDDYNLPSTILGSTGTGYGTGGTFTVESDCWTACTHWICDWGGCTELGGTGSSTSWTSETQCYDVGFDSNTGECTTWNCTDTGCVSLSAMSGQFGTLASCTGTCQSWSCLTGTYERHGGGEKPFSWSGGGCELYNPPNYGTGGTFVTEQQCTGGCRSWDCTTIGCDEVSLSAGTGATFITELSCTTHCESYNCFDYGCIGQLGSGGTWFNKSVADWGLTACTGVCLSYNCQDLGCLPAQLGSGGTYFSVNHTSPPTSLAPSALTSCTASCLSYECFTAGCQTYNAPSYGTGGTWQEMSGCTACTDEQLLGIDCPCINWGCFASNVVSSTKIYAYYDTTSMGTNAVKDALQGIDAWVSTMQNYTGSVYHTLINDERWLDWATSVYTGTLGAGLSTVLTAVNAWPILNWASGVSMTNVYDNTTAGQSITAYPNLTTVGLPPVASNTDDVLIIIFADESATGTGAVSNSPYDCYTSTDAGNADQYIPNFIGLTPQTNDQPSPTWKVDYTGFSGTYLTVTAASGTLNCFIYPTESANPQVPHNQLFALNVVASIAQGNQTPGGQGQNWGIGTAPRRAVSGGILNGIPPLCGIADLTALEVSNPYISQGYGRLDLFGWDYNISFAPYTQNVFQNDLDNYLSTITSNLTICTSAETSPTSLYPYPTLSACTADCYSFECTSTGCEFFNGLGSKPTYYSTLDECQLSCTSWSCLTSSPCVQLPGTGSTFLFSADCVTACTSHNCEDITPYTLSSAWSTADGCIEQVGSGGTFYEGSSFLSYSACTGDCRSWDCTRNCEGTGTTGCTEWSNTAATYTSSTACTSACTITWYCTEEYSVDTCSNKIDSGYVDLLGWPFNSVGPLGASGAAYFSNDPSHHFYTFSNYKYTAIIPNNNVFPVTDCPLSPNTGLHYNGEHSLATQPNTTSSSPGYWRWIESIQIIDSTINNPYSSPNILFGPYYNWFTLITDLISAPNACLPGPLNMNSTLDDVQVHLANCNMLVDAEHQWCQCYDVPCDVFCDDGTITIPPTAIGPYSFSGDAKSACCEEITWSCITATTIDSCSGKTTLPNQYSSASDAYDWVTVNLPNTDLNTLRYESTTPAINISGACQGPNGGALYETSPISFGWLNAGTSYNPWNLFINQLQGAGITGVLSGMSYTNVNQYVFAQQGESIDICAELCFCQTYPCNCIEIYDGTGLYLTHDDCMTGNTGLPACCPGTGYTGTSWNCVSGVSWSPICTTKPYLGHFNDEFSAVDNFRQFNPLGTFGNKRFTDTYNINNLGGQIAGPVYTWTEVWTSISASSIANGFAWQSCYKEFNFNWAGGILMYFPYQYVENISHPAVTGGLQYSNWNSFYTAAAAAFTLTTSLTSLQVCQEIDAQYWGSNIFGCVVETNLCCNRDSCYCYEVYDGTGDFSTEAPCLTACCPTYTGWTCCNPNMNWSVGDCTDTANPLQLPCSYVTSSSPILIPHEVDSFVNSYNAQAWCNNDPICEEIPVGDFWSCVTTNYNTCNPDGTSNGELTGFTPQIGINNVQYPFSSSTDQYHQFLPNWAGYLGGYGQVEEILTDFNYYSPTALFSSTTFQLGSFNMFNLMVDPNNSTADLPLPYTLPQETCYGTNTTGGTGMPMFHILSISNNYINSNTEYYSWDELVTAAQNDTTIFPGGFAVSNTNNVNDFATLYPMFFSCDSTTIAQGIPMLSTTPNTGHYHWSGCSWHIDMVPCLCDTTCCCESGFTSGYISQILCDDPINGCCPSASTSSYTCTINGCIDLGNGTGPYTGLTALQDCLDVCKEWECHSSTTISDSCSNKTIIPAGGGLLPDITEYSPNYSPFVRGVFDALAWFADAANGLQGQDFTTYKWDCGTGCGWSSMDCDANYGAWKHMTAVYVCDIPGPPNFNACLGPYTIWVDLINDMNTQVGPGFSLTMLYNDVAQLLEQGLPGATPYNMEIYPVLGTCHCSPGPCDCLEVQGTGHTGAYNYLNYAQCQQECCSAITINECSILITGKEEGVLYYDFATNTTVKLFDELGYDSLDIAARQQKLWLYKTSTNGNIIREYDCTWAPFQKTWNRDITVNGNVGRGLTPTENANELITANDKVYKLDISGANAVPSLQFSLPSGYTCTGDIVYDSTNGNMIITYGTGATQYVGAFTSSGVKLQESHINSTTPGIGLTESIDSLFNSGTWSNTPYPYFVVPYNGPIYGITTDRRVIELITNPLQFAPVETQTLSLVNQVSNNVHGATNILNIINGQFHDCVDINITPTDVYWCDDLLGCLPYPPNVTPPNSTGPHPDLPTCQNHCNFVCGDCVGSCECTLTTTPVGSGCNPEDTMNDCIQQNLANTNIIHGGEGCCDCFACQSVTFDYYDNIMNVWTQQTVTTNMNVWGNFAYPWIPGNLYSPGDVVMFDDPEGNTCCYTLVYLHYDTIQTPYDAWVEYTTNVANGNPTWPGGNNEISWIACDPDCPTQITWSCVTGTTVAVVNDTCGAAQDTGAGGLSFTPQIQAIAMGGYTLWNTQFQDLKWDCGSQQVNLPAHPCPAPMAHWAKILGCRITHIGGQPVNPIQGALKTTWADFIDLLNGVLVSGGIYNFPYSDRWQDLEAILGSQSYDGSPVPGNPVDIECIWEYCQCDPSLPSPLTDSCINKLDITTDMQAWVLATSNAWVDTLNYFTTVGNPHQPTIADPASGDDTANYKYEVPFWQTAANPCFGPLGGVYKYVSHFGIAGCRTRHAVQAAAYIQMGHSNYGQLVDFWNGQGMNGTVYSLNYNDNWSINQQKIEDWCGTGPDVDNGNVTNLGGSVICNCTYPPTPSYEPCHCEPIYGPGGYPTSAACEEVCCTGATSWSCDTGYTEYWSSTTNYSCSQRVNTIPVLITNNAASGPGTVLEYISDPVNGFQYTNFNTIKYVNTTVATGPAQRCHDIEEVMTPNGQYYWQCYVSFNWGPTGISPVTTNYADIITALQGAGYPTVNMSMTMTQLHQHMCSQYGICGNYSGMYTACGCFVEPCECVEITGTTGYPTSASCVAVCCEGDDKYKCTITGCLPDPNGQFITLASCTASCQSWECIDPPCIGSCSNGGSNTPRTELPIFGIPSDMVPYFASTGTPPIQSPLLPPIGPNMQDVDITYYKFDCVSCGSSASICDSPHGKWWAPSGFHIENLPTLSYFHYSGPHFTWQEVIDAANLQGFWMLSYNSTFDDVVTTFAGDGRRVIIKGMPCYGQSYGCDCVLINGTGATNTWDITQYTDCYDACCDSGDTYDCINQIGCVLSPNGTGQYPSLTACTGDCREWECVAGAQSSDDCAMNTFLNIDWSSLPYYPLSPNPQGSPGAMNIVMAQYFADPVNGLQHNDVNNYKFTDQVGPTIWGIISPQFHCEVGAQWWTSPTTTQPPYGVYSLGIPTQQGVAGVASGFRVAGTPNPGGTTPSMPGTTAYVTWPGPNGLGACCYFDTWADLISSLNAINCNNSTNNQPLTLADSFMVVRDSIIKYFNIYGAGIDLPAGRCLCTGTACSCTEWQGTGYTNFHTSENNCLLAASATPCCTPPDDLWSCHPGHSHAGTGTQNCVCVQGPGGIYQSLHACKMDINNCCDAHYYDCIDQGTPQANCVGLANNTPGPYQTAQQCYDDCPKTGYNCEWVDIISSPGAPSQAYQCVTCFGIACQYTYITSAGAPYFGDALAQCQANCPGHSCWKCCMDKNGWITQLSPSLPPNQCVCPKGTVEVLCDGTGPCPYPVSCIVGFSYNWSLCKCVCDPDVSCAPGYHWSHIKCQCVPNYNGPVDFVGTQGEVLESISDFTQKTVRSIINEFVESVELLVYYRDHNYGGDECGQCTDGTQGTCFINGCLYLIDNQCCSADYVDILGTRTGIKACKHDHPTWKVCTLNVGWKSLLVDGTEAYLTTSTPILPTPGTTGHTGCANITYDASCPNNVGGSNNTQHNDGCSTINGQIPTPANAGDYVMRHPDPRIWKIVAVGAQNTTSNGHAYTTTSCFTTGTTTGGTGWSCVDDPNNPPAHTKCLEYGTAQYVAYYGTTAPQYATLTDCYQAGCDNSPTPIMEWCCMGGITGAQQCIPVPQGTCTQTQGGTGYYGGPFITQADCQAYGCGTPPPPPSPTGTSYYVCAPQVNSLVGENQEACIAVQGTGGLGTFISLNDCLNSGCAGWFTCDPTLVPEVNGVSTTTNCIYPVPMCCESYINSSIIPLTVENCKSNCTNMNETWFPLYNVTGINTYYESPLAYLTRELLTYVNNNTCLVSLTPETFTSRGYTMKTIYNVNYNSTDNSNAMLGTVTCCSPNYIDPWGGATGLLGCFKDWGANMELCI